LLFLPSEGEFFFAPDAEILNLNDLSGPGRPSP
jgi:hypothetical protein